MPQSLTARTVLASTALAAPGSGSGAALDLGTTSPDTTLRLELVVAAISGSLTVTIETSDDGATWSALKAFPVRTTIGRSAFLTFAPALRYVRASYVLTGTSATFSVAGSSLRPFVHLGDLERLIWPEASFTDVSDEELDGALASAELAATNVLAGVRYTPPFSAWDDSIRQDVMDLAAWDLMSGRIGFNPEAGGDVAVRTRYTDALRRLNAASYVGLVDSTTSEDEGEAYLAFTVSSPSRLW